jgi:hypothetical protein
MHVYIYIPIVPSKKMAHKKVHPNQIEMKILKKINNQKRKIKNLKKKLK